MSTLFGAIIALVIGIFLILWAVHIVLTVLGWILVVAGIIWVLNNLFGNRTRI